MPAPPNTAELPTPADRPGADVVLYDGRCNFCRARVRQLDWFDRAGRLSYLSLHDPEAAQCYPDVPHDRLLEEMCVVDPQGRRHWGAHAVRYLSRRLPRLWWLAPVMHLPGGMLLWRPLYKLIARNRYLIAGRAEDCDNGACAINR